MNDTDDISTTNHCPIKLCYMSEPIQFHGHITKKYHRSYVSNNPPLAPITTAKVIPVERKFDIAHPIPGKIIIVSTCSHHHWFRQFLPLL